MRNLLLIAAACAGIVSAQAQAIYYQDSKNCDMLRHVAQQDRLRREFVLPEVNGYKVLKADLHTHTIYSDGQVTPDFRVEEAWLDGLDVLAIADHVEYRKWEQNYIDWMKGYVKKDAKAVNNRLVRNDITKEGIQVDLNLPYRLAEPVAKNYGITLIPAVEITRDMVTCGHFNALFITDANSVFDNDPAQSMRNARAQGALIMENHPGWTRKNLEMNDFEKKVFAEKLIDGIEIMNGPEFYPCVATRAVEQGLFMAANTDIHNATASVYGINGQQRDMTLILARDNSPEAIKEALLAHRTLAYAYGSARLIYARLFYYKRRYTRAVIRTEQPKRAVFRRRAAVFKRVILRKRKAAAHYHAALYLPFNGKGVNGLANVVRGDYFAHAAGFLIKYCNLRCVAVGNVAYGVGLIAAQGVGLGKVFAVILPALKLAQAMLRKVGLKPLAGP